MGYWLRRSIVFVCLVLAPIVSVLVVDVLIELERTQARGLELVQQATSILSLELESDSRRKIETAILLANELGPLWDDARDEKRGRASRRDEVASRIRKRLGALDSDIEFAWLVDERGRAVLGTGIASEKPRDVSGHPLFQRTQSGAALDEMWRKAADNRSFVWAAGAPTIIGGKVRGAVILGWKVDDRAVNRLASALSAQVTLLDEHKSVVATSMKRSELSSILESGNPTGGSVNGRLAEALPSPVSGLPLLIGPRLDGYAFASSTAAMPGTAYEWMITVPLSSSFRSLAGRQLNLFAIGISMAMMVILFSIIDYRTYITPIRTLSDHLSEIQLGRGEVDLPEPAVSRPFRRLVRLVNMTVQKLPNRSLSTISGSMGQPRSTRGASLVTPSPSELPFNPTLSEDLSLDSIVGEQRKRSANDVRGGTPIRPESDEGRASTGPSPRPSSVRGGGSLHLSQSAHVADDWQDERPAAFQSTAVAAVEPELLAASARPDYDSGDEDQGDMTVVANVDPNLLSQSATDDGDHDGIEEEDWNHFKEVYHDFLDMRRQCGERTKELGFDRFLAKLQKNRAKLVEKYNCKTVRFQVYEKDGKAALKATPVRAR